MDQPRTRLTRLDPSSESSQDQFLVQNNLPLASAMSFVLMAIITILVVVYSRFFGTDDLA